MLLALSILVVSLAFVLYHQLPRRWLAPPQRGDPRAPPKPPGSELDENQSRDGKKETYTDEHKSKAYATPTGDIKSKLTLETPTFKMNEHDQDDSDASTPKAAPALELPSQPIPELSLSNANAGALNSLGPVQKPAAPAPRKPASSPQAASSLMPPPAVRPSALRPLPKASSSLAPPPSAASSLRAPPGRNAPNSVIQNGRNPAVAASTSTLPPASRPRKKIILPPGHSPLDWAALTRNPPSASFLRGEGIPPRMLKISPAQMKHYNGRKGRDAWGSWQGKVYNLTPYKDFHPGGVGELMRGAGKPGEAERLFNEIHPWVNWDGMLAECLVGVLVGDGEGEGEQGGTGQVDMDEMD